MALYALGEEAQQANSGEINRLAQILIGGIDSLNDPGSQGCGAIVAGYISSCSSTVVEKLIEATLETLNTLATEVNQAIEADSVVRKQPAFDALKKYLNESIPVLEKGYQYNAAIKNRLENTMPNIVFNEAYKEFISCAFSLTEDPRWIASRPPQTIDEFSQLFEMLAAAADAGDFQSSAIKVTNEIGLLNEFKLDAEELESLIPTLADYEGGLGALDAELWLLIKVCGVEAIVAKDLFDSVRSNVSALRDYAEKDDVHKQAAALSLILSHYSNEELTGSDVAFIDSLCNAEVVSFLKERNIDLIPRVLELLNSDENALKTPCDKLLSALWTPDAYAKRDREDFFTLIAVKSKTAEREEQGRLFAESGRINELIEKGFNICWLSVYCGAFEGLKERNRDKEVFSDWIVRNLEIVSIKDWHGAIRSTIAKSLIDVMSKTTEKIQLPQLDKAIGQEASGYPSESILKILVSLLDVYNSNLAYIAECITNRIIVSQSQISMYVQGWGALLTCCRWLHSLTPEQRYFATEAIIKTRRTHDCEWLYINLSLETAPKLLYKGFLKKTKMLLGEQMGYKTMRKGAREACGKILELLK